MELAGIDGDMAVAVCAHSGGAVLKDITLLSPTVRQRASRHRKQRDAAVGMGCLEAEVAPVVCKRPDRVTRANPAPNAGERVISDQV